MKGKWSKRSASCDTKATDDIKRRGNHSDFGEDLQKMENGLLNKMYGMALYIFLR